VRQFFLPVRPIASLSGYFGFLWRQRDISLKLLALAAKISGDLQLRYCIQEYWNMEMEGSYVSDTKKSLNKIESREESG
jgi:hypothetical protein